MDDSQSIQIKIEKDIDEDPGEDVYEEYSVAFQDCKAEEGNADHEDSAEVPQSQQNTDGISPVRLNTHTTKALTNHFVSHGCSSKSYNEAVRRFSKAKVDAYSGTVNRLLKEAPEYVHQECESLCFVNISKWLEVFKERNVPENSYYEPGIVINAIANSERHPEPADMNGVDLKAIYTFLSNGLLGLPQKPLPPISAKFLNTEFQCLINEANSDFADTQTVTMKEKLETQLPKQAMARPSSIDPLFLLEDTIIHRDTLKK